MKAKKIIRIILSPFVFLMVVGALCVLTFFPLPILVFWGLLCLIVSPFVWLFRLGGSDIDYPDPIIGEADGVNNRFVGFLLMATIYIWAAPYFTWRYIKTGEIFLM